MSVHPLDDHIIFRECQNPKRVSAHNTSQWNKTNKKMSAQVLLLLLLFIFLALSQRINPIECVQFHGSINAATRNGAILDPYRISTRALTINSI